MTEREIFATDGELIICAISDEDRKDYVELHRQLNGETSLYLNPRSIDMMWEQTLNHSDGIFSLFKKMEIIVAALNVRMLACIE